MHTEPDKSASHPEGIGPSNPYHPSGSTRLSPGPGLPAAVAMGLFVSLSTATILLGLFFGVLVAVGAQSQAVPFDLTSVYSQGWPLGLLVAGTVIIAVGSALLGSYSARRILRAAQRSRDLEERRRNMTQALRDLRDAAHRRPEAPP